MLNIILILVILFFLFFLLVVIVMATTSTRFLFLVFFFFIFILIPSPARLGRRGLLVIVGLLAAIGAAVSRPAGGVISLLVVRHVGRRRVEVLLVLGVVEAVAIVGSHLGDGKETRAVYRTM
jgi:hypothetical protein